MCGLQGRSGRDPGEGWASEPVLRELELPFVVKEDVAPENGSHERVEVQLWWSLWCSCE